MYKIFVYGTLMSTGRANNILRRFGPQLIGPAVMPNAKLHSVGGNFPALLWGGADDFCVGELWSFEDDNPNLGPALRALDAYEGVPALYYRDGGLNVLTYDEPDGWQYKECAAYVFASPMPEESLIEDRVWDVANNPGLVALRDRYHEYRQRHRAGRRRRAEFDIGRIKRMVAEMGGE